MRIVFMGTPDFAVPSLAGLLDLDLQICLIVSKPDARRGRGRRFGRCAVKKYAAGKGMMIYQPAGFCSAPTKNLLRQLSPDAGVIVAFGEILEPWMIRMFPRGVLNVHASLLPAYRGAAPISRAILNGEDFTGVTVQRLVPQVDAGPVLAREKTRIGADENAGQLHDRLSHMGARLLCDVLARLAQGENLTERAQDTSRVTLAPKLGKEDGRIDWSADAESVRNRIRAMTPWPGAFCMFHGKDRREKVTITRASHAGPVPDAAPGTVVSADEEGIVVAAGDGCGLRLTELKPAGGRVMAARDFIHGRHVESGELFA